MPAPQAGRWIRAIAWASCALFASTAQAETKGRLSEAKLRKGEALVIGSSSIKHTFGRVIAHELTQRGYRVLRRGVSGAGLARPDYRDMNALLDGLPISEKTSAVFVYLGVNDAQALWLRPHERSAPGREYLPWSNERWPALYTQRAHEFFERICQRGARRMVVLLPVDVEQERLQRRLDRIRTLQARAASSSSCAVALPTGGDQGRFEVDGVSLRRGDGFHMSREGAQAVWDRIEARALRLVDRRAARPEPDGLWCAARRCG